MSLQTSTYSDVIESNVRKRRAGRAYAISSIIESLTRPSPTKLTRMHEVLCHFIWVDLIGFHIGNATEFQFCNSERYPYFASRMRNGIPEELLKISEDLGDSIYTQGARDRIMVFVQRLDYEDSITFLDTHSSSRFYRGVMNNQIGFVQDLRVLASHSRSGMAKNNAAIERSCKTFNLTDSRVFKSSGEGIRKAYDYFATLNEDRLVFFLEIIRKIRISIADAASSRHLPQERLVTLRMRLREFDQRGLYSLACSTVAWASPEESKLIADSEAWWEPSSKGDDREPASGKIAHAYASDANMRSTLAAIVTIFMLLSVIPAATAWSHSKPDKGSMSDSNIWQALASSILQLLSLVTLMWPTLKSSRLS